MNSALIALNLPACQLAILPAIGLSLRQQSRTSDEYLGHIVSLACKLFDQKGYISRFLFHGVVASSRKPYALWRPFNYMCRMDAIDEDVLVQLQERVLLSEHHRNVWVTLSEARSPALSDLLPALCQSK